MIGLVRFSISSLFNLGKLYISRNLVLPSMLSNLLVSIIHSSLMILCIHVVLVVKSPILFLILMSPLSLFLGECS